MQHDYFKVINYENALEQLHQAMPPRRTEWLELGQCRGRRLAEEIFSPEALPAFPRSSVDGYAINADDSYGASESIPAILELAGEILMGQAADIEVPAGQCAWIPTGGMLPASCNAVVMVEHTEKLDENTVLVHRPVSPGENLMLAGEDVGEGQPLFSSGHILRAVDIGLLAALGMNILPVSAPYKIAIISSGDEIVDITSKPGPGQVRDVNTLALAAAVEAAGECPVIYPRVPDDYSLLSAAVASAQEECDLILISGGSSIGVKDMSLQVLLELPGAALLFHGLAIKPGKPTLAVQSRDGLVIGLPGHPVSALTIYYVLCQPLFSQIEEIVVEGVLSENYASQAGRDDFVPVSLQKDADELLFRPLLGKSGLISILARADGYIHVKRTEQGLKKGSRVKVHLFEKQTYINK